MNLHHPFQYIFGLETVKEDLSELTTNTLFANGRQQETQKTTVSPFNILDNYAFSKDVLTSYFNKFIKDAFNYQCDFKITTSWMTKLGVGEQVHYHNHVNSMWSAVFYFDEYTEDSCPLLFRNPIPNNFPLHIGKSKDNQMTKDWGVQPEHNLLVIFPSWIFHYSKPNKEKERKSLAFNFMPSTPIGMSDSIYDPSWNQQ